MASGIGFDFAISRQDVAEMSGTTAPYREPNAQRVGGAGHRRRRPAEDHDPRARCIAGDRRGSTPPGTLASPLCAGARTGEAAAIIFPAHRTRSIGVADANRRSGDDDDEGSGIPRYRTWQGTCAAAEGFRPFFLAAGLWAAGALALWLAMLQGAIVLPTAFDPVTWHAHEMLFGFCR